MSVDPGPKTFTKIPDVRETGSLIPCPLCGQERFSSLYDCGDWRFVRCRSCGLALQNPQPDMKRLLARYDDEYFSYEEKNETGFLKLALMGLGDIGFDRLAREIPDQSILDIGCATGILLNHFKIKGWKTAGVEVCRASARFGNERYGVGIFNGILEEAPFADESFSVIHSSHVIEHLNHPVPFVERSFRLLKPGGLFICTTPDRSGFQARLFGRGWRSAIADHLFLFRTTDLNKMMRNAGLQILKRRTWGGLGEGYATQSIKRFMDKLVKLTGQGDVVIMVARKPKY